MHDPDLPVVINDIYTADVSQSDRGDPAKLGIESLVIASIIVKHQLLTLLVADR